MNSIPRITSIRTAWLLQNEKKKPCNGYTQKYKKIRSCDSSYQKVKKAELHCIAISTCRILLS